MAKPPAPAPAAKTRVQLDLDPPMYEDLQALKLELHATSYAEVFRRGLRALRTLIKEGRIT